MDPAHKSIRLPIYLIFAQDSLYCFCCPSAFACWPSPDGASEIVGRYSTFLFSFAQHSQIDDFLLVCLTLSVLITLVSKCID